MLEGSGNQRRSPCCNDFFSIAILRMNSCQIMTLSRSAWVICEPFPFSICVSLMQVSGLQGQILVPFLSPISFGS